MAGGGKQISNPFSTGGGGVNFEVHVQSSFVALMLAKGFAPCLPCRPITKIKLQGKHAGFDTDDLIVFSGNADGTEERKILAQLKHSITITESNEVFSEVIRAAWSDFCNARVFAKGRDVLALITGPLSATDISDVRTLLEWSRSSESHSEFLQKVATAKFSSTSKRAKLQAFRKHLDAANGAPVVDEDFVDFLSHFHLLGYDLDIRSGVMHSLLHSLIGQTSPQDPVAVWSKLVEEVRCANQNSGTITPDSLPDEILEAFRKPTVHTMPDVLTQGVPPRRPHDWKSSEFATALVVANIVGSWDENSEADISVVRELTEGGFDEWQSKIRQVLQMPDSPLKLRNGVWSVTHRKELWETHGPCVFDIHLDGLKTNAIKVLKERDPLFDIEPGERYVARFHGKVLTHSDHLRRGLAESLALVGSFPKPLTNCSQGKLDEVTILTIREIFKRADWRLWGSLNDLLPLLAEVSPGEFLNAVEAALSHEPSPFEVLYSQEDAGLAGRSYITGLLWALESISWNEQFLIPAAVALGLLANHDPGRKSANRPGNSLTHIFLPWFPQTLASIEKRLVAVATLRKECPDAAWELLISLLPEQVTVSSNNHKPQFRQWLPSSARNDVSREDYSKQVIAYAEMAVEMAAADNSHLIQLVSNLDHLPRQVLEKLLTHIESEEFKTASEDDRFEIWSALVEITTKHRRYSDTDWALPKDAVAKIEVTASRLAPTDPQKLHRRLFRGRDWELYGENQDWQKQDKELEQRRQAVVEELLSAGGIVAVVQFAEVVESPNQVGLSLAYIASDDVDAAVLPSMLNVTIKEHAGFAAGFVWGRYQLKGWTWVDGIIDPAWPRAKVGGFLRILPFTNETWQRVGQLLPADAAEYWANVGVNPYQSKGGLRTAIAELIKHGRPCAAIDCLAKQVHDKEAIETELAVKALLDAASNPNNCDGHEIGNIINALQDDPDTDERDLFAVEWAFLPILERHRDATPKFMEKRMANDPEFFCDLIRMAYRSPNDTPNDDEPTEAEKGAATNAWRLLHTWHAVPGTDKNGGFSSDAFKHWVEVVKRSTLESGHLDVALSSIGNSLIHCFPDPDGLPLHRSVAEVLNESGAEAMRNGYAIAIYNARGFHCVDPTGQPEKELAGKYREQAEEVENAGYHRLAATLRHVADSYDREASRIIEQYSGEPDTE